MSIIRHALLPIHAIIFALLFSAGIKAQGIQFSKLSGWQAALQEAAAAHKPIFVDAYTTWCGPCILMDKNVFSDAQVGTFFNDSFINLKVQMDSTGRDNESVRIWYADAAKLADQYQINGYPTLLFFNSNGEILHKILGFQSAEALVARAKDALRPEKQYFTLRRMFQQGNRDSAFLKNWIEAARNAYDLGNARRATLAYLSMQTNWLSAENAHLVASITEASADTGFLLMSQYPDSFNTAGKTVFFAQDKVRAIIQKEFLNPLLFPDNKPLPKTPNWKVWEKNVMEKYPQQGVQALWLSRIFYFEIKGNKEEVLKTVSDAIREYPNQWSAAWLNQYAWQVFEESQSSAWVNQAVQWAGSAVAQDEDPLYVDTLANLLHKAGQTKEAIQWMKKAIAILQQAGEDTEMYEETLTKMEEGEATWK